MSNSENESVQLTVRDQDNACIRRETAARQRAVYEACLVWAQEDLGAGWVSGHRHDLLDIDEEDRCRRTGEKPVLCSTTNSVKNAAGEKRHFTVDVVNFYMSISNP